MIKTIKLSFKTFSSFMLTLFTLSLCADCFFAHAETLFGSELSGMLGIHKLQAVSELVSHRSAACLFVMGMLCVFFFLLVLICFVALGVVRFYVWTLVESAVSSAMGSLRSFNGPCRRFGARLVVSLIESSLRNYKIVKDGSMTVIQDLWEAGFLKLLVFVAAVVQTTTSRYHFAMKRSRRFVLRFSFVFILLMELMGVVGALGGVSWLRFSAVGLLLVAAELGRSSAATKATLPARLDLVETSSCRHFDSSGPLGDSYGDGVALEGDFERSAKSNGLTSDRSESEEPSVSCRPSMISDWRARFLALRAQNAALAVADAIPPTPSAPVKLKRILQRHLPAPVELARAEEPVDMDWESAPPSAVLLNRKRRLEDSAAAVSSKRQRTLEYSIPIVEDVNETFAAACCDEQVDTGDSYTNNQPNNSSDLELASEVDDDADGCIGASGCEESVWQLLLVGYLPVISEESETDAELDLEEQEEEEVSFSAAAEDAKDLVAVVDEEEEEPEKVVNDSVVLSRPKEPVDMDEESAPPSTVLLNRKRRLEDSAAAVSSKRQRTLEYPIPIVEDVNETFAAACCDEQVDTGDSYTNNQPSNSSDPELASEVDDDADGCIGASGCEESVWQLLLVGYLPVISEESETDAELDLEEQEEEEVSFSAAAEDAKDAKELVAVVDEEEEEPEKVVNDSVVLSRPKRKLRTFGPCNRTRPYLKRQCKENVRYAK